MMENIVVFSAIALFALTAVGTFGLHWYSWRDEKRSDERARLRKLKSDLESQVRQLKSDKTVLENRVANLTKGQPEVVRLATRVGWLELDKARLEDRMAGLGEEQTATEDQISWLENQIRWLEFDNAVLESQVTLLTIKSAA